MATLSSILVWRIPWTEEPGGLQSMGLQRAGHDWAQAKTDRPNFKDEHSCDPKVLVEAPQVFFCSSSFSCNSENACKMLREVYHGKINSTKTIIASRKRFNSRKGVFYICTQRFYTFYNYMLKIAQSPRCRTVKIMALNFLVKTGENCFFLIAN